FRDRSRVGGRRLRAALVVRRAAPAVSGWLHDPHAAAGDRVLRGDAAEASRAQVGALRHASSALGTGARAAAVLRPLLRDVAPLGAESEGPQGPDAVDA